MTHSDFSERGIKANELRVQVALAVLELEINHFRHPGATDHIARDKLDAAACALADNLREPETCRSCGQEIPA